MTRYVTLFNAFLFGSLLFFGSVPTTANAAAVVLAQQQSSHDTPIPAASLNDGFEALFQAPNAE